MEESSSPRPLYCWNINTREHFYSTFHYNNMYITIEVHTTLFYKFKDHVTSLPTKKKGKSNPGDIRWYFLVEQQFPQTKEKEVLVFNLHRIVIRV